MSSLYIHVCQLIEVAFYKTSWLQLAPFLLYCVLVVFQFVNMYYNVDGNQTHYYFTITTAITEADHINVGVDEEWEVYIDLFCPCHHLDIFLLKRDKENVYEKVFHLKKTFQDIIL